MKDDTKLAVRMGMRILIIMIILLMMMMIIIIMGIKLLVHDDHVGDGKEDVADEDERDDHAW